MYQFKATIEGRVTEAEVQAKEAAKQTYDEAIEKNETAFLIEESSNSGDIFKCKIGNLPPETEAVLSFSYVVDLATTSAEGEDDAVVFTLPSVLNPRYCPAGFRTDNDQSYVDGFAVARQKSKYEFDFQLDIDPVFPVKNVEAFGDQVEVSGLDIVNLFTMLVSFGNTVFLSFGKQGRIHGSISRVRVGRGSIVVGQGQ